LGGQRVCYIPPTVTSSQLRKDERTKLAPPTEPPMRTAGAIHLIQGLDVRA
jgi:hypothetical protein